MKHLERKNVPSHTHFYRNAAIFAVLAGMACAACKGHGKKLTFGKGEIYYKDGVTKAEATKVGKYLRKTGYFDDKKAKSVQVLKSGDTYQVKFVVKDPKGMKKEMKDQFRVLGGMISNYALNGAKLEVHLCDRRLKTKDKLEVAKSIGNFGQKLEFGRGEVYYQPPVEKPLAQKLGQHLLKHKFFNKEKRKSVQLTQKDAVYHLKIVVTKKNFAPSLIQLMTGVGKNLAVNIFGGQKLKLSLCDASLNCFKTLGPF